MGKYFYFVATVLILVSQYAGMHTSYPLVGTFFLLSLFRFSFNLALYNRIGYVSPKRFLLEAYNLDFITWERNQKTSKSSSPLKELLPQLPQFLLFTLRARLRLLKRHLRQLWYGPRPRHPLPQSPKSQPLKHTHRESVP